MGVLLGIAVGTACMVGTVFPPVLAWVGLSAAGPVAGGAFAALQASGGAIAAGSWMAAAQSAAMLAPTP